MKIEVDIYIFIDLLYIALTWNLNSYQLWSPCLSRTSNASLSTTLSLMSFRKYLSNRSLKPRIVLIIQKKQNRLFQSTKSLRRKIVLQLSSFQIGRIDFLTGYDIFDYFLSIDQWSSFLNTLHCWKNCDRDLKVKIDH